MTESADTLRRSGLVVAQADMDTVRAIRCIAAQLLKHSSTPKPGYLYPTVDDPNTGELCSFRCATKFPNTEKMFYLNADNAAAVELFAELFSEQLAETCEACAGEGTEIAVHSAQLIVVIEDSVRVSNWHKDYGAAAPHSVFSGICGIAIPEGAGGLEYKPWDSEDGESVQVAPYEEGKIVVFDGNLDHRTQPYKHAIGPRILAVVDCYGAGDKAAWKMVAAERGNGFSIKSWED